MEILTFVPEDEVPNDDPNEKKGLENLENYDVHEIDEDFFEIIPKYQQDPEEELDGLLGVLGRLIDFAPNQEIFDTFLDLQDDLLELPPSENE